MAVRYHEQHITARLRERRRLSSFLQELIRRHRQQVKTVDLTYIFCNDAYLLEINQQFLNHNTLTDIITFDMSDTDEHLQGEVYISVERVKENALKFGARYEEELHRVIFHGALHLCGFKDKGPSDKQNMRRQEDICLAQYFRTNKLRK